MSSKECTAQQVQSQSPGSGRVFFGEHAVRPDHANAAHPHFAISRAEHASRMSPEQQRMSSNCSKVCVVLDLVSRPLSWLDKHNAEMFQQQISEIFQAETFYSLYPLFLIQNVTSNSVDGASMN